MGLFGIRKPSVDDIVNLVISPTAILVGGPAHWFVMGTGSVFSLQPPTTKRAWVSFGYTPSAGVNDGIGYYQDPPYTLSMFNGPCTFACDFWGAVGVPYRVYIANLISGVPYSTPTEIIGTGSWQRVSNSFTVQPGSGSAHLCITKNGSTSVAEFYVDGLTYVSGVGDPGFISGEEDDCYWRGQRFQSASVRRGGSHEGGIHYDFQDLGFYIDDAPGAGVPDLQVLSQNLALLPGSMFIGERLPGRTFSLVGHIVGTSVEDVHAKRAALFNLMKSDLTGQNLPYWLTYNGARTEVRCKVRYSGGLSFGAVAGFQEGFRERVALQFYANDPFWYEDGVDSDGLLYSATIANANYILRRKPDGTWVSLSSGFNGSVNAVVRNSEGNVCIGGAFTLVGGANGNYVVKLDPVTGVLSDLDGGLDGVVNTLAVAGPYTYAGGSFTNRVMRRRPGVTWAPLGTSINNGTVYSICIGAAGLVYIAGTFTNHGDANGDYITSWDGTNYISLGTGANGAVWDIAMMKNGNLVAVGVFTTIGGVSAKFAAQWNGSVWAPFGDGTATGIGIYGVTVAPNGDVIFAGNFSAVGGIAAAGVAIWDGEKIIPLGTGVNATGIESTVAPDGSILLGGTFTMAGGLSLTDRLATWDGYTWAHVPIDLPGSPQVNTAYFDLDGSLYIGFTSAGTAYGSYPNALTNRGSARGYPVLRVSREITNTGTVTLSYLRNEMTGATIWLNCPILPGEEIIIDFRLGRRSIVSSFKGNLMGSVVLRNSDFANFYLLPGKNTISAHALLSGAGAFGLYDSFNWAPTYWSFDGGA